jgi:DNA-binding Lrp family transcriptional regulator
MELKLVSELMKNSRRSDRELAKVLGVSQPTVSRMIKRFEKEEIIQGYCAIPNLAKLGMEIVAIVLLNLKHQSDPNTRMQKAEEFVEKHPNLIFASSGIGSMSDRVAISVHKSYSDYTKFVQDLREHSELYTIVDTFLISYKSDSIPKPLSFKTLGDYITEEKPE